MTSFFQHYSRFSAANDQQQYDQVVDVTGWPLGGELTPYPEGTRSKSELYCPADVALPFLIPQHRYLYKKTIQRKSRNPAVAGYIHYEQFWVEIVAYHLGRALHVSVPPAFVACRLLPDSQELEYACLIEWYYGYPNAPYATVARGGELIMREIEGYDREKGRQHNFLTIESIFRQLPVTGWLEQWARLLLFDALIGNTDRHQENWEIVLHHIDSGVSPALPTYEMSPAFDNGTALGYEVTPENIAKQKQNIASYIAKGTHHMKWNMADEKQQGHFELLQRLVAHSPEALSAMEPMLRCDLAGLYDKIRSFTTFEIHNPRYRLTPERAEFMVALLDARFRKAKEVLDL